MNLYRVFKIPNVPFYRASHKMFQTLSCIVRPVSTFLSADELFPKRGVCGNFPSHAKPYCFAIGN